MDPRAEAAYQQVARLLADRIHDGRDGYLPGQRLPAAGVMARQLRLGVDAIRDAYHLLVHLGLLSGGRGYGPMVRTERDREIIHLPAGTAVSARMPTFAELDRWELEPGVPMLVAGDRVWPADRYQLVAGGDGVD